MKYSDFKRYKFSAILNYINNKKYKFSSILNYINIKRYKFTNIIKLFDIIRYELIRFFKSLSFKKLSYYKINRVFDLKNYKYLPIYFAALGIFVTLMYLFIPAFYSYDKSNVKKAICTNNNINCEIKGKIKYSFYPTPRIRVSNIIVRESFKSKKILISANEVALKLSINNLLNKNKQTFKKILVKDYEVKINLKNVNNYKKLLIKNINFFPLDFSKGKVIFLNGEEYVSTINNSKIKTKTKEKNTIFLNGNFLDDNIKFDLNSIIIDKKREINIEVKMNTLNLITKAKLFNLTSDDKTDGSILIKKGKNKLTAVFNYENNELTINKSTLRNTLLDGKLKGKITFLPYFNFDLETDLNSLNFTKLYSNFLLLEDTKKKKIFKINNKINGKMALTANKIYSSYGLVKSFESRLKFNNGNIYIDQFLLNLGKLGAADISGIINNKKKYSNFKYETNIYVDNQKKFLSKFGIYNFKKISPSLFISGNIDLDNLRSSFYEISTNEKLKENDINFIEREFTDYILTDDYKNLFNFPKLKEFIKSITTS